MSTQKKYDSTVARIAGNLLSRLKLAYGDEALRDDFIEQMAVDAVRVARAIVAETARTEPKA